MTDLLLSPREKELDFLFEKSILRREELKAKKLTAACPIHKVSGCIHCDGSGRKPYVKNR